MDFHMNSKADRTARRLSELLEEFKHTAKAFEILMEKHFGHSREAIDHQIFNLDPDRPSVGAAIFLSLDDSTSMDAVVLRAFEAAGLDPKNIWHWRLLVQLFAEVHFGQQNKRGAPLKWDALNYLRLYIDVRKIQAGRTVPLSETRVCEFLRGHAPYKERYGGLTKERLRKLVREARDPRPHVKAIRDILSNRDAIKRTSDPLRSAREPSEEKEAQFPQLLKEVYKALENAKKGDEKSSTDALRSGEWSEEKEAQFSRLLDLIYDTHEASNRAKKGDEKSPR
jgi:hypothetical protein